MNSIVGLEFQLFSQKEYIDYVLAYGDDGTGELLATDYTWSFVSLSVADILVNENYPISSEEWISWLHNEQTERLVEWGYDSIASITNYWLRCPEKEPIILFKTSEGEYSFSDGYHRFAIAVKNKLNSIPVILGTPRSNQ